MKKYICLLLLLFLPYVLHSTESDKKKDISGSVVNPISNERIDSVRVELMRADSTIIDTVYTKWSFYSLKVNAGKYILRFSHPDYETAYKAVDVESYRSKSNRKLEEIKMIKKKNIHAHVLGEVTVNATKIKFYVNGDTLVYNANAFHLSEGSMLDALVKQLPGAELKSDGRIFMNGRYIESILLNGKDFIKDDNKVLLNNLPAYMVSKVRVYDKEGDLSKIMGRDAGDKTLVMDVQLKREYSLGRISNIEIGGGSNNRYLGKVFSSMFTSKLNFSVFGNANNLNDMEIPGEKNEYSPTKSIQTALLSTKSLGLQYNYGNTHNLITNGIAQVTHNNTDSRTTTNSVNFLSGGDTYGKSLANGKSGTTSYLLNNMTRWLKPLKGGFDVITNLMYIKTNGSNNSLAATFSDEPSKYFNKGLMDSIFSPNAGSLMRRITINRNTSNAMNNSNSLNFMTYIMATINTSHSNYIKINGTLTYLNRRFNYFNHSRYDYPSNSSLPIDKRNQYVKESEKNYNYKLDVEYWWNISSKLSIVPSYKYEQSYTSNYNSLYRLDHLNGWDSFDNHELGSLPSTTDSLYMAIDANNSYYSHEYNDTHTIGSGFHWHAGKIGQNQTTIDVQLPFRFEKDKLVYQRASIDTTMTRNIRLLDPEIKFTRTISGWKKTITFSYNCKSTAPSMTNLLNVRDDSNPLNITLGNSNLKNTHAHNIDFSYRTVNDDQKILGINAMYTITQNALAMGYVYDKSTGVRTIKPDNVNGNWNGTADVNYTFPLDAQKLFTFNTGTNGQYAHSVDLISVTGSNASSRSSVHSLYLTQSLKTGFHKDNISFDVNGRLLWTHSTSAREDFNTINATDFNYGVSGQIEFPWNMQISMDLTEYSRRGYEDHNMNTNEMVWNTRLSQKAMHGHLIFMVDGFDILSQLSNVQRVINAQGRVETYYNAIPRYMLFHVIYRFNKQPKKHK